MGYYTNYKLELIGENGSSLLAATKAAEKMIESLDGIEFLGSDIPVRSGIYWYGKYFDVGAGEKEIVSLSKDYPDVLFQVTGDGEDSDDFWREYIQNGKTGWTPGVISYEPFDQVEMKDYKGGDET